MHWRKSRRDRAEKRPDHPQRLLPLRRDQVHDDADRRLSLRKARTCSICRMRGAVAVTSTPADFRITRGEDKIATYRFNTKSAEHHFCSVCGIYTHHKRRSNPDQLGVNVACLEGVSPFDFEEIVVYDGLRHPADNEEHKTYVAGVLRFEPASG